MSFLQIDIKPWEDTTAPINHYFNKAKMDVYLCYRFRCADPELERIMQEAIMAWNRQNFYGVYETVKVGYYRVHELLYEGVPN